ncbi:MAG TPA: ATP-binding protein [Verrucomicrobiae bacterium]|nr:ATP-binding protein [Verrucomicrobiae bacterium]
MEKYLGIIWQRDKYTEQFVLMFRYMALVASLFLIAYGLLIRAGAFSQTYYNENVFVYVSGLLLVFGLAGFLVKRPRPFGTLLRILAFHALATAYLLGVSGFQSPIAACWILLMMSAYYFFGLRGLIVSGLLFIHTAVLDFAFWGDGKLEILLLDSVVAGCIVLVGSAVILIGHIQNRQHADFQLSRTKESFQRERILALVNSIGDAILNIDSEGVIRLYNAASLDFFDTNESLNGKRLDAVLRVYDKEGQTVSFFEAIQGKRGMYVREDLTYVFSDGEKARLSISCSPVRASFSEVNSEQTGHILIIRDITKAKTLEEERDEFISVVSHELRTPITIAEGTLSNAQFMMTHGKMSTQNISKALEEAHHQVLYLAKMVNDLSTLSRAERGLGDEKEEIDVEELMRSLYHEYQSEAAAKKLRLDLDISPRIGTVKTSRLYLEEILQNFINNSIKYTSEGGVMLIAKRQKDGVYFAVKDTGIGISKSEQKKVFDKFYRSEDYRTRETNGTGLGLYVVNKLAQKLSIQIELQSRLNHGSTFSFILPDTGAGSKEGKASDITS